MAVTVKRVELWRTEVESHPGILARVLGPLAQAGANLRIVMGYTFPNDPARAAVEVFPVSGKRAAAAAAVAGLTRSPIACLLAEGDDRPALGHAMANAIAEAGVNISFVVAETVGRKFSAVFGFASTADADTALKALRVATKTRPVARRTTKPKRR
jgi:hypothetical protein